MKEILQRKLKYAQNERDSAEPIDFSITDPNEIDYDEFIAMQDGEIKAYSEMLEDIEKLSEEEFVSKYHEAAKKMSEEFEKILDEKYDKIAAAKENGGDVFDIMSEFPKGSEDMGYNNAVLSIMMLYSPENSFC